MTAAIEAKRAAPSPIPVRKLLSPKSSSLRSVPSLPTSSIRVLLSSEESRGDLTQPKRSSALCSVVFLTSSSLEKKLKCRGLVVTRLLVDKTEARPTGMGEKDSVEEAIMAAKAPNAKIAEAEEEDRFVMLTNDQFCSDRGE